MIEPVWVLELPRELGVSDTGSCRQPASATSGDIDVPMSGVDVDIQVM